MREAYFDVIALSLDGLDGYTVRRGAPDMVHELLLSVDIEFEMTAAFHVHHIFSTLFRGEHRFVLGGEILQLHPRGEVMHTCRGDSQRCGVVLSGNRFAFHITVIPESTLHTLLSLEGALGAHQTVEHLVVGKVAPGMIE